MVLSLWGAWLVLDGLLEQGERGGGGLFCGEAHVSELEYGKVRTRVFSVGTTYYTKIILGTSFVRSRSVGKR